MIVRRNKDFSIWEHISGRKNLYHMTKDENVDSIYSKGLLKKMTLKPGTASSRSGLSDEERKDRIYLSKSRSFLPMKPGKGKSLIKLSVPMKVYESWKNVGDPISKYTSQSPEQFADYWISNYYFQIPRFKDKVDLELEKQSPSIKKLPLKERFRETDIYKRAYLSFDPNYDKKVFVSGEDIDPKYIVGSKSYKKWSLSEYIDYLSYLLTGK